jgi:glycosyltransferase involved in cell wall biosynthesis
VVNDGSTDGTEAICQRYAETNQNVRIISKVNEGLSVTRNVGIVNAKGKYVCFVDADDYLTENGLARLLPYCDGEYDLIRYWSNIVQSHTKPQNTPIQIIELFQGYGLDYVRQFGLDTICWNWLFRREFLVNYELKFVPRLILEDFRFMADVLFANPYVISLALRIYNYFVRIDSITTIRSPKHSRHWVEDLSGTICYVNEKAEKYKQSDGVLYSQMRQSLEMKIVSLMSRCLSADFTLNEFKDILIKFHTVNLLPLKMIGGSLRLRLIRCIVNLLFRIPLSYLPAKYVYRVFFLRFIYPRIDRNR